MAKLTPWFFPRFTDENGKPLATGLVYSYEAGTSTPKATYTNDHGTTANSNPLRLDAGGMNHLWLASGAYKIIVTDGVGATIFDASTVEGATVWTEDVINGSNAGNDTIQVVATIAALKAFTTLSGTVIVKGYYAALDNGGGTFYYDSANSDADNGGTVIIPTSAPATGRWMRLFDGSIDVRWFGAKGDASTNDTAAFAAADDYAYSYNKSTIAHAGTYVWSSDPTLTAPIELRPNAILEWTGFSPAIIPLIYLADDTRHFNYSDAPTFPATMSIKNTWMNESTGWYQYHLPTNSLNDVIIINDNAGTWEAGSVVVTVNGTAYTQAYAAGKNTEMTSLAALIATHGNVLSAAYSSTAHTITITPQTNLSVDVVTNTTGITGTMTMSLEKKSAHALSTAKRLITRQGATVASTGSLVLGNDGNVFVISGTTQINLISNINWPAGSEITLVFQGACIIKHNTAADGDNKPIIFSDAIDMVTVAGDVVRLVYDSQTPSWRASPVFSGKLDSKNLTINTAGSGIKIKEGSNARMGVVTFAVESSKTVNNTSITANTRIFLTLQSLSAGSTVSLYVSARTPGTSFVITALDPMSGTVAWLLIEPA